MQRKPSKYALDVQVCLGNIRDNITGSKNTINLPFGKDITHKGSGMLLMFTLCQSLKNLFFNWTG